MANIRKNGLLNSRIKGDYGEDVACKYLKNKGFTIVGRNYRKVWGEIDIIAEKDNVLHFIEVKSVTIENFENFQLNGHRPEDNVHGLKVRHIRRMVETYFEEYDIGLEREFSFHVICVYLNFGERMAKVHMIENIIL